MPNDDDDDDDFKCFYKENLLPSSVYLCHVFSYLNFYT